MNKLIPALLLMGLLTAATSKQPLSSSTITPMQLNAGIITEQLTETKKFYQEVLGFGIRFENEWYLLLHTPGGEAAIAFLQPEHPGQHPLFRPAFAGKGVFLTIEVEDVDAEYQRIRETGVSITIPLRDEPWGDRHFAITDPNGVGIDIVKYTSPE